MGIGPNPRRRRATATQTSYQWLYIVLILIVGGMMALTLLQRRQAQRQRRMMQDQLARGDWVVTLGGIVGQVVDVNGDRVRLKVGEGVELELLRWGIGQHLDR